MKRALRKLLTPKVFYLHFNRQAAARGDKKVWSVQTSKGCMHAERVVSMVPLETVHKPDKKQNPRAFLRGRGFGYWCTDDAGDFLLIEPHPVEER